MCCTADGVGYGTRVGLSSSLRFDEWKMMMMMKTNLTTNTPRQFLRCAYVLLFARCRTNYFCSICHRNWLGVYSFYAICLPDIFRVSNVMRVHAVWPQIMNLFRIIQMSRARTSASRMKLSCRYDVAAACSWYVTGHLSCVCSLTLRFTIGYQLAAWPALIPIVNVNWLLHVTTAFDSCGVCKL